VFEFLFKDHHGANSFVKRQQLLEVLPLFLSFYVFTVFQQQILAAFVNGFILLAGSVIFTVSDLVDDTAKIGYHMKKIEYDFRLGDFFLTALMNGSHISITTASMQLSCSSLN